TGELGQGSRTALPIFAYFMEQVLKDKDLKQYQARFPQAKARINKEYGCRTIYHPRDTDSIARDSIALEKVIENVLEE
ncbi:hypothetical protein ACHM2L_16015, partial [Clostridium perfringens]|uniref:hypothetical protein n=1 Tax=Clostridium perfringens TaxID=1502 RepID=UPI00375486A7